MSQYGIRMGVKEGYNVTQGQYVTIWEEGHCESIKNVTEWIFLYKKKFQKNSYITFASEAG